MRKLIVGISLLVVFIFGLKFIINSSTSDSCLEKPPSIELNENTNLNKHDDSLVKKNFNNLQDKKDSLDKNQKNIDSNKTASDSSSFSYQNQNGTESSEHTKEEFKPSTLQEAIDHLSKKIPLTHLKISEDSNPSEGIDSGLTLVFNTLKKDSCFQGDLDAISLDLDQSDLLLSIEAIMPDDSSFDPQVQFVSPESLERGSFYFSLPKINKAAFLGLYLCKDSKNSRRCNNKSFQSISKLISVYQYGVKVTNPQFTQDKIYFFQSFILTPTDIYILDTVELNKNTKVLKESLSVITGMSEESLDPMIKRLKAINKTIYSENVSTGSNSINLFLPKYQKEACSKEESF